MRQAGSPMQLTRAADYGIRAMIHLASLPDGCRAQLPDISSATGAPGAFLSKVLQPLIRCRMVESSRGANGGYQALAPGRQATLRNLIEAIDGPISLNACVRAGDSCRRKSHCPAHPVWLRAQQAMMAILNATTVAELAAYPSLSEITPIPNNNMTSDHRRPQEQSDQSHVGSPCLSRNSIPSAVRLSNPAAHPGV